VTCKSLCSASKSTLIIYDLLGVMKVTKANLHEEEATVRDANEGEDAQASVILLPPLADHVRVLCSTATHNITIASPWIKASALTF